MINFRWLVATIFFMMPSTPLTAEVSDAQLIFRLGADSIIANHMLLGSTAHQYSIDPKGGADKFLEVAKQINRTANGSYTQIKNYATEREIESSPVMTKLLEGYRLLILRSDVAIAYVNEPADGTRAGFDQATAESLRYIDEVLFSK